MPMDITQHEEHLGAILETLTDGEQISAVTEHLEALRLDYTETVQTYNTLDVDKQKLQKERDALIISNSQYFRDRAQIPEAERQEQTKVNENVTLESLGI